MSTSPSPCIQRRASDQIFVVQVARVDPRRIAADAPRRGSNSHAPEERVEWNLDSRSEACNHALIVKRDNFHLRVRKLFGKKTRSGPEAVIGVRNG